MIIGPTEQRPASIDDLLGPELSKSLSRLDVASKRVFAGRLPGERRSKRRGQSVEFDDYRTYVPGDDLRHIDWNVFARMDRFFLKLFREEEDVTVEVVLDLSPSMDAGAARGEEGAPDRPSKRLFAARLGMALAYIGLVANNRVRLTTFGRGFAQTPAARGRAQAGRFSDFLLERLGGGEVDEPVGFTDAMSGLARTRSGSGVVVVISDMLIEEGYESGLNYLAGARGFESTILQTLAPSERDPSLEAETISGDLQLMDIETGRTAEVTITPEVVAGYHRSFATYQQGLARSCRSRSITYVDLGIETPLELAVLRRLRETGLVR